MENNPLFEGVKKTVSKLIPLDDAEGILKQVSEFDTSKIFHSEIGQYAKSKRQYEFVMGKDGIGHIYQGTFILVIRQKSNHFKHQDTFIYRIWNDNCQIIPFNYQTLSNMSKEEIKTIRVDFYNNGF